MLGEIGMQRLCAAFWVFCMAVALTGCAALHSSSSPVATTTSAPMATVAPSSVTASPLPATVMPKPSLSVELPTLTPTPADTSSEPVGTVPASTQYTSTDFGLTFTVPESWIGKYRVVEGGNCLTVYFNPAEGIPENSWSGELFSIARKYTAESADINGDWEFEINGATYIWGMFDGLNFSGYVDSYGDGAPEYNRYMTMRKDIPAIFTSVKSLSGQALTNKKRVWIDSCPRKRIYTTTMGLGIQFIIPQSWIGKCRIVETKNFVTVYFKPRKYNPEKYGDGYLLSIEMKTTDEDEEDYSDSVTIRGADYFCYESSDVSYDGPEDRTFSQMTNEVWKVFETIKAAK